MQPTKRFGLGQAIGAFLNDLVAGDPVALSLVGLFLAFLFVLVLVGGFILVTRLRRQAAHERKLKRNQKAEKKKYEQMKDADL
jgi:hypothetical protein